MATLLAGPAAWGHTFPPVHTVVVQVERCEIALLIGYAAGTGESTERIIARVASQPKSHAVDALRDTLAAYALAPLTITVDGVAVVPTAVRAKIGLDAGGKRPVVVVLASVAMPRGGKLAIASRDPRTTRISWHDRGSSRVVADAAPTQGKWFSGVASFLLPVGAPPGGSSCATPASSHSSRSASSAPAR
ncbi:MAG: hypothetical protein H7138_15705 [Myxococcales bacterium]|nr:hypothetical protein [Myxococcales bacterium]